jgi:hypothetical protein
VVGPRVHVSAGHKQFLGEQDRSQSYQLPRALCSSFLAWIPRNPDSGYGCGPVVPSASRTSFGGNDSHRGARSGWGCGSFSRPIREARGRVTSSDSRTAMRMASSEPHRRGLPI